MRLIFRVQMGAEREVERKLLEYKWECEVLTKGRQKTFQGIAVPVSNIMAAYCLGVFSQFLPKSAVYRVDADGEPETDHLESENAMLRAHVEQLQLDQANTARVLEELKAQLRIEELKAQLRGLGK